MDIDIDKVTKEKHFLLTKKRLEEIVEFQKQFRENKHETVSKEKVNHPTHYNTGKIEVIDFIEDQKLGFKAGNVVKYVCRNKHKNGLEDLKKARWYLDRLIEKMENGETE